MQGGPCCDPPLLGDGETGARWVSAATKAVSRSSPSSRGLTPWHQERGDAHARTSPRVTEPGWMTLWRDNSVRGFSRFRPGAGRGRCSSGTAWSLYNYFRHYKCFLSAGSLKLFHYTSP